MSTSLPNRAPLRLAALCAAMLATGVAGAAETPLPIVASSCPAIPASRSVSVTTTQPLVAGQSIVLAVGVDSADAPDLQVSGPTGVSWSTLGGHKSEAADRSVLLLRGTANQSVASGASIDLGFSQVEAARAVCVRGMRYSGFITGGAAINTDGQAQGLAAEAPVVNGKQAVPGSMAIAAFLFSALPNALTLSGSAVSDGGACNAALDLCLRVAHQGDVVGAASIGMTPASASDWQATLAVLSTPRLFADGFE